MNSDSDTFGFPTGYFIVRSVATNRLLDVTGDEIEDGTEIILWPETETSLVESFREPRANNQVFFIDTSGALCSRSSGHAIDVEGDRLVLRHRRPVSQPFPNEYAHPLPRFSYSPHSGEITVHFTTDPSYPPPGAIVSNSWKTQRYLLTSVPMRRPRTLIDDASAFISTALLSPMSLLGGKSKATPDAVFGGEIDLKEDEVVDEERGEEAEVDDSSDLKRLVRMISVSSHGGDLDSESRLLEKTKNRRRWIVLPLRKVNAKTGGI